jgi:hypothetical protein
MLRVLYRGRLSSCNYGCQYCPFAKKQDSRAELEADYRDLERFVTWALARKRPLGVLFTPWGEALIRRPYQEALVRLTNAPARPARRHPDQPLGRPGLCAALRPEPARALGHLAPRVVRHG